ncbi:Hypothetical protein PFR_JS22-1_277 [Propionibacterium freudenreichii]|nr:Hypothetical protein PFR_JS22-1_277 [Propionibacterium freudenreichii]
MIRAETCRSGNPQSDRCIPWSASGRGHSRGFQVSRGIRGAALIYQSCAATIIRYALPCPIVVGWGADRALRGYFVGKVRALVARALLDAPGVQPTGLGDIFHWLGKIITSMPPLPTFMEYHTALDVPLVSVDSLKLVTEADSLRIREECVSGEQVQTMYVLPRSSDAWREHGWPDERPGPPVEEDPDHPGLSFGSWYSTPGLGSTRAPGHS